MAPGDPHVRTVEERGRWPAPCLSMISQPVSVLTSSVVTYIARAVIETTHRGRFMVLAIVLAMAGAICSVDHVNVISDSSDHVHGALSGCVPDLCVTVTSKGSSWSGNFDNALLLWSLFVMLGRTPRVAAINPLARARLLGTNHFLRASDKLYQLHAVYLL